MFLGLGGLVQFHPQDLSLSSFLQSFQFLPYQAGFGFHFFFTPKALALFVFVKLEISDLSRLLLIIIDAFLRVLFSLATNMQTLDHI